LVEINSFGSTESYERFEGEVNKYLVKNLTKFSASDQKKLQENPFYLYELEHHQEGELDESLSEILLHRPRPVAHLSETCRIHLKDLLEHLEETGMPYHLNPHLFPQSGKHCETVYTIVNQDNDETLAYGERFTTQARSLTQKSMANEEGFVHCAAISIALAAGKAEKYTKVKETKKSTPHVYFAHSGAVAKRNTLNVLSMLHDANIAVKHAIIKNSLREQLYHCERNQSTELEFPVTLILGVKEMQDGTIIVRNNLANRQKAVPLNRMCSYVKRALK